MALRTWTFFPYVERMRARLVENPHANISDLIRDMNAEETRFRKNCQLDVFKQIVVNVLFRGNRHKACTTFTKYNFMKPDGEISSTAASEASEALWVLMSAYYQDELDELMHWLCKLDQLDGIIN